MRWRSLLTVNVVIPCYDVGPEIRETLIAVLGQVFSTEVRIHITLVDDGSLETLAIPAGIDAKAVFIIRHAQNRGLAAARNTGANSNPGDLIWFLDADCVPGSTSALQAHLNVVNNCDVSVGPVRARQLGFWGEYQNLVAESRHVRLRRGLDIDACTSANLVIRRSAFEASGGFDERYRNYGFEDRDFLQRILHCGLNVGFAAGSVAYHDATLDLKGVCRKMEIAGRYSSTLFRIDHPLAYRNTSYGRLDVRDRPLLFRIMISISWTMLKACRRVVSRALQVRMIPFAMRALTARVYLALAYAYGTSQADHDAK